MENLKIIDPELPDYYSYLSPTRVKAAPAHAARQSDTTKDKENHNNYNTKDHSKQGNCGSIISISKMNSKTVDISTESFINLFLGKKSSGNWFKEC